MRVNINSVYKEVQEGKDQEKAQSEKETSKSYNDVCLN